MTSDPSSQVLQASSVKGWGRVGEGGSRGARVKGQLHVLKANTSLLPLAVAKSKGQEKKFGAVGPVAIGYTVVAAAVSINAA